jgi:hypothetical protein
MNTGSPNDQTNELVSDSWLVELDAQISSVFSLPDSPLFVLAATVHSVPFLFLCSADAVLWKTKLTNPGDFYAYLPPDKYAYPSPNPSFFSPPLFSPPSTSDHGSGYSLETTRKPFISSKFPKIHSS